MSGSSLNTNGPSPSMQTILDEVHQSQARAAARRLARERYQARTRWLWIIALSALALCIIAGAAVVFGG